MKRYFIILFAFTTLLFNQNRSVIYNTGSPPDLNNGYTINIYNSVANKFTVSSDYVLEAMVFYMTASSINSANINLSIREDNNGVPGELLSELSQWNHNVSYPAINGYNLITTTNLCIYLDPGETYWWTIEAGNIDTDVVWAFSEVFGYQYASSENGLWTANIGNAGSGAIYAEQVYNLPFDKGDVNFDFLVNVVDIVQIVGHILDTNTLTGDSIDYADINSDGNIDVVDIVQLVSSILSESPPNPDFILEDINPASEFFGQNIGPSFFDGQVSVYYFGKQG